MNPTLIIGAVLLTFNLATGLYAWDADHALKREHDRAQAAEMQRDQLFKAYRELQLAIAERNRRLAQFSALPEVRKRLCAVRGAGDPCCSAQGKCEP